MKSINFNLLQYHVGNQKDSPFASRNRPMPEHSNIYKPFKQN